MFSAASQGIDELHHELPSDLLGDLKKSIVFKVQYHIICVLPCFSRLV